MFVRLANRNVVVVGGGDLAARTVHALNACDAQLRVFSRVFAPVFRRFRGLPNVQLITRPLEDGDLEDVLLALAVDDDPQVNLRTARQGLEWNVLVSVADELSLSDFVVPSFVHRGGLTLALQAGILNPSLARRIGEDLERALGPEYGDFIGALERAHDRITQEVPDAAVQQSMFDRLLGSDLLEVVRHGGRAAGDARVDQLLAGVRLR